MGLIFEILKKRIKFFLFLSVLMVGVQMLHAKPLELSGKALIKKPPRIVRACCSFGYDLKLWGIPFAKISQVAVLDQLGSHHYLGSPKEGKGIIYTRKGGFIDLAHLRDQADKTAYFYSLLMHCRTEGIDSIATGIEGANEVIFLQNVQTLNDADILRMAARISYDLSVWHEIATWYGVSWVPFVSERFSSFSVEDVYSNLLGVILGMKAVESDLPFEEAMTVMMKEMLIELGAVESLEETLAAYDLVHSLWWTNAVRLPGNKITLHRHFQAYSWVFPLLVPDFECKGYEPHVLNVPETTTGGCLLSNHYQIRFMVDKQFTSISRKYVTQLDFNEVIETIAQEWTASELTNQ
jgi:hypothetical protein